MLGFFLIWIFANIGGIANAIYYTSKGGRIVMKRGFAPRNIIDVIFLPTLIVSYMLRRN